MPLALLTIFDAAACLSRLLRRRCLHAARLLLIFAFFAAFATLALSIIRVMPLPPPTSC